MKELFDIIPNSTGDGFRMQLSTGVIDVPEITEAISFPLVVVR